jgi:ATP-binding cassette, subfamily B, bacterial PglK
MVSRIRRYLRLLEPGKRIRWAGVVVLALVVSGLEATGAVLVYGLVALTSDPEAPIDLPVLGDVRRWLPELPQDELLVLASVATAAFFILRALIMLGQQYYQSRTTHLAGVDLSSRLFARYLQLPYAFHLRRNSSELIRNTSDSVSEILGSVITPAVRIISDGLMVLAIVVVLVVTAPLATGLAALALVPLVFITMRIIQPRIKRLGRISQEAGKHSYQALQQGLHGYRDITVLGRQDFFLDRFRTARHTIAGTRIRRSVLGQVPRLSIEATVITLIATFIAVSTLADDGAAGSLPVIGLFAYAALRVMPALNHIVSSLNAIRFGGAALEDVEADLALPLLDTVHDVPRLRLERELCFEQVSFQYEGTTEPTLHELELVINHGESIGVVGATGAGKSTLIDLLVGLSRPTAGRITVDGVDLRGREAGWQQDIGLVSQQVYLLDDTLRRNIGLGVRDEDISEEQVREAVRLAQLEEFVASLPQGLDTVVGEGGVRVSGGQRQRVAIARALYRRPSVLVFDEGTSALDNLTEAALTEALAGLREDHTIITVAHRLSTVQSHDRIVFMHEGRIVDVGGFVELTRRNEDFRRLARWSEAPA